MAKYNLMTKNMFKLPNDINGNLYKPLCVAIFKNIFHSKTEFKKRCMPNNAQDHIFHKIFETIKYQTKIMFSLKT